MSTLAPVANNSGTEFLSQEMWVKCYCSLDLNVPPGSCVSRGLVPWLALWGDGGTYMTWAYWKVLGYWGHALDRWWQSSPSYLFLCSVAAVRLAVVLQYMLLTMMCCLPTNPKANCEPKLLKCEQHSLLSLRWLSQVFCHSDRELTVYWKW
jgi:hypothetical protein